MSSIQKSDTVLEAREVRKGFKSGKAELAVLRGVDLKVTHGECVSIRGASGSGKSTLLNILAGLDTADSGDVLWGGDTIQPLKKNRPALAARRGGFCGFVFQSYYLVPELNAYENIILARRLLGPVTLKYSERTDWLMDRLGIASRAQGLPNELSGGERQRVAIARALLNEPKLLIADEPTGNLDEHTSEEVVSLLLSICRELQTACILVTHNLEYANRADQRRFLSQGQLTDS